MFKIYTRCKSIIFHLNPTPVHNDIKENEKINIKSLNRKKMRVRVILMMMIMFLLGTAYAFSSLPQIFVGNIVQLQHDRRKNFALAKTHDHQFSSTTKFHQFDHEVLDDGTTLHSPKNSTTLARISTSSNSQPL
jgi:hypothetical protein